MTSGVAETRDTIAAIATPSGRGGIGVVRISGANVASLAARVLGKLPPARRATLSRFRAADGEVLDQGIAIYFPPPNSYTGEPVLELHGHGGPVVLQAVLSACLEAGARVAQPGEFTKRAFLSGKLDLAQAESVADLIDAASREAARSALRSLSGEFSAAVNSLVQGLMELRLRMEAMLDFPEEEVGALHRDEAAARLAGIRNDLDSLLGRSRRGSLLASGIYVVIAGRPNVGKSSLLNRLLGTERAIVTPIAGTTRDAVREPTNIEGVPLVLVDTAGLRLAPDEIERMGIERTHEELGRADVVLAVFEAGTEAESLGNDFPTGAVRIDVYNKLDLAPDFRPTAGNNACVLVSAMTGAGLDELRQAILTAAGWCNTGESVFLARERHLNALEEARSGLARAAQKQLPWEFFAEELRLAQSALGEITGEISADDMLGEIFSRFCIGK